MRVAVVQGGPSSEASVSRASAAAVAGALEEAGHAPSLLELDAALPSRLLGHDVVFPLVHGALGEDGCLQGLCEILELPYVGSGVLASALAMDKIAAKVAFRGAGLPVARENIVRRGDVGAASQVRAALGPAVAVKPSAAGSAIGVRLVRPGAPTSALEDAIAEALRYDDVALCEELVVGREVTCGVTDATTLFAGPRALPPTEILAKRGDFYDFSSKYAPSGSEHVCPAELPAGCAARVQELALAAHRALGCRDLSRADFIVGDTPDRVVLLEVNTLPGMTATSLFPEAMARAGVAFPAMCDALVRAAELRGGARRRVPVPELPR